MANIKNIQIGSTTYDIIDDSAARLHHLYHTWDSNTNYFDSYSGDNMFRIITENMYADNFRFQASTVSNKEYWNYDTSAWVTSDLNINSLFDGNARTTVYFPYAQRKFRFCITASGGWPTTALFMLQGTWYDWGSGSNNINVIIETRSSTSDSWVQKESFSFTQGPMGANARTLSNLHTGHVYYRVTFELPAWTKTTSSCPINRICLFSNYNGGGLTPITFDGNGNVAVSGKTISASSFSGSSASFTTIYGTHSGSVTIGDGSGVELFRTNGSYLSGMYYSTPGNEAHVFANINPVTSWIFATTNPNSRTDWTTLTPSLQIKNQSVVINKLIASGASSSYNLDVNGTANATTLYQNGVQVQNKATVTNNTLIF